MEGTMMRTVTRGEYMRAFFSKEYFSHIVWVRSPNTNINPELSSLMPRATANEVFPFVSSWSNESIVVMRWSCCFASSAIKERRAERVSPPLSTDLPPLNAVSSFPCHNNGNIGANFGGPP